MMRRPVRILILLLTVAVTAGVVWKATINEQARGRMRMAAQQNDAAAADAVYELADLRSSLHAYVAPGQGIDFWSKRAEAQLDSLGSRLRDLEPAAAAANHSLSTALSSLDGLADSEKRARSAMRNSQPLVAGDIVFEDARDQIDAAARDLADARQAMSRVESAREAGMANEQSLLAGGLMAVWIFALIVLVPVPAAKPAEAAPSEPKELPRDTPVDRATDRDELRLHMPAATANAHEAPPRDEPVASAPAVSDHHESQPGAPVVAPELTARVLDSIADLCTDLARVANLGELSPLLDRAAGLLQARGVVVWLVSPDGQHLAPAMAHGYDENQLARIGSIGIGDDNLTAAAFRTGHPTHATADAQFPGAVAVPILAASGPSGVLAAEVPEGTNLPQSEALAALIAAQLAGLFTVEEVVVVPKLEVGSEK
jgi:GAF domain